MSSEEEFRIAEFEFHDYDSLMQSKIPLDFGYTKFAIRNSQSEIREILEIPMFCPVCESEYQPGVTRCPDDNVELVDKLDSRTSHDDSGAQFVLLHNFGSPAEAEMVDDIFKRNNIRSVVRSGGDDTLSPLLSSTALGAAVLVDERDYDRADELYQSIFAEDATPLTGVEVEEEEDEYRE